MARFSGLPNNVMVEIMSWLPPESLFRFKCVQKSWHALINAIVKSPWFVAKHLKNSENILFLFNRRRQLMRGLGHYEIMSSVKTSDKADDDDNGQIHFNCEEFTLPHGVSGLEGSHCNGILFLPDKDTNKIILCNPTIKELRILENTCFASNFKSNIIAGFGHDAIANVYKVVRVVRLHGKSGGAPLAAEVCTLGSTNHGDSWREIGMKIDISSDSFVINQMHHKGVYYWFVCTISDKCSLISFDMHSEEFHTISLPQDIRNPEEFGAALQLNGPPHRHMPTRVTIVMGWRLLALWDGSVTLLEYVAGEFPFYDLNAKPIEMWVLDDSYRGVSKKSTCWIRHASLLPQGKFLYFPMLFWKRDELLFITMYGHFASYNLITRKTRSVHFNSPSHRDWTKDFRAFACIRSLASIHGTGWNVDSS